MAKHYFEKLVVFCSVDNILLRDIVGIFFVLIFCRGPPLINLIFKQIDRRINMKESPKRRKYHDNPYEIMIIDKKYFINFKDSKNIIQKIEVNSQIYEVFNDSELHDLSELNEYDRHIEHSEIFDISLYHRSNEEMYSLEKEVEDNILNEELRACIRTLPEVQRRRIIKYYFDDKNEYEIAEEEGTTHQAVNKSLKQAREKLKEILKK